MERREVFCPVCREVLGKAREVGEEKWVGRHGGCETELDRVFAFGWREGALAKLVAGYKYKAVWAHGPVLAELLDAAVPRWVGVEGVGRGAGEGCGEEVEGGFGGGDGLEVVVVPLPTIGKHIRERGLDHTLRLAKGLAKRRGWKVERVLARATDTVQVGAKAEEREKQAARTYEVVWPVRKDVLYLLVDDVWTTGASMRAAARKMREAGAEKIYGAVLEVGRPKA